MHRELTRSPLPVGWRVRLDLEFSRRRRRLGLWLIWRIPRRVVYWCGIRLWANATTGAFGGELPTGLSMDVVLQRWEKRQGGDFQ